MPMPNPPCHPSLSRDFVRLEARNRQSEAAHQHLVDSARTGDRHPVITTLRDAVGRTAIALGTRMSATHPATGEINCIPDLSTAPVSTNH